MNKQNGQPVATYRTIWYLYIAYVTKANLVIMGGLRRYRGGLKSYY